MYRLDAMTLHRWNALLRGLCMVALVFYGIEIFGFWLLSDVTIAFSHGVEIWSSQVSLLPFMVQIQLFVAHSVPLLLWAGCALFLLQLARHVQQQQIFIKENAQAIKRAGLAIFAAGITSSLVDIMVPFILHQQNVLPWMADFDLDDLVRVETLFGGAFFFCIGKILESAVVLSERDRLTI